MIDPGDVRLTTGAGPILTAFNRAGLVSAADTRVGRRLGELCGETDEQVLLAAALLVRALRSGSVCLRLDDLGDLAEPDADTGLQTADDGDDTGAAAIDALMRPPWPAPSEWLQSVRRSPMVHVGHDEPWPPRPLRLVGPRLYLDRYLRDERLVAAAVDARARGRAPRPDDARLATSLDRYFPGVDAHDRQRQACAVAAAGLVTVVTGGPGTGKTTTVARLLAVLTDLAGSAGHRIALAAPTGKAAARLTESVGEQLDHVAESGVDLPAGLGRPTATTVHRLLGWCGSTTRFRYDRGNRLPHDLVVLDETSMVSLPLMARLIEALRPQARLVLVGDADQLASVEAGAALADIVARLESRSGTSGAVVRLDRVHRYGPEIHALAEAIRRGDASGALDALRGSDAVVLREPSPSGTGHAGGHGEVAAPLAMAEIRDAVLEAARVRLAAARAGDASGALRALGTHRVLVAHRHGPYGLADWSRRVAEWEASLQGGAVGSFAVGTALLVTSNDRLTGLANGDTGVVIAGGDHGSGATGTAGTDSSTAVAAFGRPESPLILPLHRLPDVRAVHALTVHRSQGSQYDEVMLVLPPLGSPLLTRELLYTAVTRARRRIVVLASAAAVAAAVERPVRRASGLREIDSPAPQDGEGRNSHE